VLDLAGLTGLAVAAWAWWWPAGLAVASMEALAVSWRVETSVRVEPITGEEVA
jgi:hypothetical protein